MSSPGVEPGLRPSRGRVRHPPHSEDAIESHAVLCHVASPVCHLGIWNRDPDLCVRQCPRQESNLVCDLRGVACESVTLQGQLLHLMDSMRKGRESNPQGSCSPVLQTGPVANRVALPSSHLSGYAARLHLKTQRKARDSNPHAPRAHSLAGRPGQPYPATFRNELSRVDSRGVEPRSSGCRPEVFPSDQPPMIEL